MQGSTLLSEFLKDFQDPTQALHRAVLAGSGNPSKHLGILTPYSYYGELKLSVQEYMSLHILLYSCCDYGFSIDEAMFKDVHLL